MADRICTKCKRPKDSEHDFSPNKRGKDGLHSWCKACVRKYSRKHPKSGVKAKLKRNYGITPEVYDAMFDDQKGCCAICQRPQTAIDKKFAVDHDHITGAVRGLLCYNCNHGLADFHDSPEHLATAILYLYNTPKEVIQYAVTDTTDKPEEIT